MNDSVLYGVVFCCISMVMSGAAWAADDLCKSDQACSILDNQAEQLVRSKDFAAALKTYQAAVAIQQEPRLILNIGRCYHRLGKYDEALTAYKKYSDLVASPEPDMSERIARYVQEAQAAQKKPIHKKWWFWTIVGAGLSAAIVGGLAGGLAGRKEGFSRTEPY